MLLDNVIKILYVMMNVKLYYVIVYDVIKYINRVFLEDVSIINGVMEIFFDCLLRFKRFNFIYIEKKLLG